jgi:hypothetical protein
MPAVSLSLRRRVGTMTRMTADFTPQPDQELFLVGQATVEAMQAIREDIVTIALVSRHSS